MAARVLVFVYGVQAAPQILEQCSPAVFLESAMLSARNVHLLLENLRFLYYAISNPLLCIPYGGSFPMSSDAVHAVAELTSDLERLFEN